MDCMDDSIKNATKKDGSNLIINSNLSNRAKRILLSHGYQTLNDIKDLTFDELMSFRSLGKTTAVEILNYIAVHKNDLFYKKSSETEDNHLTTPQKTDSNLILNSNLSNRAKL